MIRCRDVEAQGGENLLNHNSPCSEVTVGVPRVGPDGLTRVGHGEVVRQNRIVARVKPYRAYPWHPWCPWWKLKVDGITSVSFRTYLAKELAYPTRMMSAWRFFTASSSLDIGDDVLLVRSQRLSRLPLAPRESHRQSFFLPIAHTLHPP